MKTVVHKASTRGHADHGWLNSHHTFSFAGYYHPERVQFGMLRVLNDDIVSPGRGFGTHPHDNMEIISIPLSGALEHKDSMGTGSVIRTGDVQIMSAGSGVAHSEFNHSQSEDVNFLQIWVFPKVKNIPPRYDQKTFPKSEREGELKTVVSPDQEGDALWINQDAWFSLGSLGEGEELSYKLNKSGNGVYLFVLEGELEVEGESLSRRDGMGISETDSLQLKAGSAAEILLMEIPMSA